MARKLSQDEVINKVKEIHGNLYDVTNLIYKNKRTKFELGCAKHGAFFTSLDQLVRHQGCPICGKSDAAKKRRVSFDDFLLKANKIHGSKYQYDKDSFKKIAERLKIKCPIHGWFEQRADAHIRQAQGCPECGRMSQISKRTMSSKEFIEKSLELHSSSNYNYKKVKYNNNRTKVEIICPKHGAFFPSPDNHLQGSGCPTCAIEKVHVGQMKNIESFIADSIKAHGSKYDSLVQYSGGKRTVQIICPKHGPFNQTPNAHQRGSGCPNCNTSKGEDKVKMILNNLDITFNQQHTFKTLIDKRKLKCDFFLPEFNMVIEFNGRQHYEPVNRFGGIQGLEETQRRDQIKRDYLKGNNIDLLEIHYLNKNIEMTIINILKIE
jgi:Zn finger protein HypA/HybF involved in hydrogenase expression